MVLGAISCGADKASTSHQELYSVNISNNGLQATSKLRVAYGAHWVGSNSVAADSRGEFHVPSFARAVVAFVDVNHNEKLDRFAEPSDDCHLASHGWHCTLDQHKVTVYRVIAARAGAHGDKTHIFWEDYRFDGIRNEESMLCVEGRCTALERSPFFSSSDTRLHGLSICGAEGFDPQDAEVRTLGAISVIPIVHPTNFDVMLKLDQVTPYGALRLSIDALPDDHILVWSGSVDKTGQIAKIFSSSESSGIQVVRRQLGAEILIPSWITQTCYQSNDCEIVMQVLRHWNSPVASTSSITEYRNVIPFRGSL